jgi:hypothetical protein
MANRNVPNSGSMLTYNVNDGYLEGLLRGYVSGILAKTDYNNLTQCETLEGKQKEALYARSIEYFTHNPIQKDQVVFVNLK